MHIITFFAPKGRAGRTVATITAAMALVEAGKRVDVLDLSDPRISERAPLPGSRTGYSSGLVAWGLHMEDAGVGEDRLRVKHVADYVGLAAGIADASMGGADVVLIDTPSRADDLTLAAVHQSSLAVMPATDALDAALIFDAIADHYITILPRFCGLVTGARSPDEADLIKKVFFGWRTLDTVLPHNSCFPDQYHGELLFDGKDRDDSAGVAQQAGRAFGQELLTVAEGKTPGKSYIEDDDMPDGTALEYLRDLSKQNPQLWQ
ncbi:MAG: division plane positioning ATPase MipZ [Roseinatronobacter sp.]